jgi:integrase
MLTEMLSRQLEGIMYKPQRLTSKIINKGFQIKINHRIVDDKLVLFMCHRKDGKQITKRLMTLDRNDLATDLQRLTDAMSMRADAEKKLALTTQAFKPLPGEIKLTDYIDKHIKSYTNKSTIYSYQDTKRYLIKFSTAETTLDQIDKQYCIRFIEYLNKNTKKYGSLIFTKFKCIMNKAIHDDLIPDMPYLRKMRIKYKPSKREFLTLAELKQFNKAQTIYPQHKRMFIFSCLTGLRYSDLATLKFTDIKDGIVNITQQKTSEQLSIPLNHTALEIVNQQLDTQGDSQYVFNVGSYQTWRVVVKKMMTEAGITKNITGHCARHTFATTCITSGVDIYTTSKLLGHTSVSTTQIYSNLVDEKKTDAIKKLPVL